MLRVVLGFLVGAALMLISTLGPYLYADVPEALSYAFFFAMTFCAGAIAAWVAGRLELVVSALSFLAGITIALRVTGEVNFSVVILMIGMFGIFAVAGGGLVALLRRRQRAHRES